MQTRHRRTPMRVAGIAALALATAPMAAASAADAPDRAQPGPLRSVGTTGSIAGEYIVVLHDAAGANRVDDVAAAAVAAGSTINVTYRAVLDGFAATLPDSALAAVRATPPWPLSRPTVW